MQKHLLVFVTLLVSFYSQAQLQFFGSPESVDSLNSSKGENYLFFDFDNSQVYFSRERHPDNAGGFQDAGDIWMSTKDSVWQKPTPMSNNDNHFSSPIGWTADHQYFLYNYVWFDKGLYYGKVMIYTSEGHTEQLNIPYFTNRSPLQTGSISFDGHYLLLSLENNQGYGVDDLYVCFLDEDGQWTSPRNLGITVNSKFQEISPFLAPDNKTLYYASNGQGGAGSFDIFYAERLDDTWQNWSEPVNLGAPVNSSGAETSFVFSNYADYAYFISTQNSDGYGDLKRIKTKSDYVEAKDTTQQLVVQAVETGESVVRFGLVNKKNGESIKGLGRVYAADTLDFADEDGEVSIPQSTGQVAIEFRAVGYLSQKVVYDLDTLSLDEKLTIALEPIEEGNVITLEHVLFYRGTANFIEGSENELDLVVDMLNENPGIYIFLKGHTDNVGNAMLNVELSQERVYAVSDYLISKGIAQNRIDGEGYGGEQPIASNETEATRKLNRRVEFEIVKAN